MKSLTSKRVKGASLSDLHMLHRRTPTTKILSNLDTSIMEDPEMAELDILFIAGDVFDDLATLANESIWEVKIWIARFLKWAKKNNIILRILEGTPSHDWKQSHLFLVINEIAEIGADIKHVKELSIEYIELIGITVLYVPDEWGPPDTTKSQVKDLLKAKGLEQVDIAVMHGQFPHQLPSHVTAPTHDPEFYLSITRFLTFIGHVHLRSKYDRILAQGSHDRVAHGEEDPKGFFKFEIDLDSGEYFVTFVENKGAQRYVTISCVGMDLDDTLKQINERVAELPELSFVRVEADADNPVFANMDVLIRKWPMQTWSKLPRKEEKEVAEDLENEELLYTPLLITRDNVSGLFTPRLVKAGLQGEQLDIAAAILKELL